jgi:hypothetical protein
MTYSTKITQDYLEQLKALGLPTEKRPNPYLVLFMRGDGERAPSNFNIQVYTGKKGLRLVATDKLTLDRLLSGKSSIDTEGKRIITEGKRIITIDDSGWGFPLGGVLCGAYDAGTENFYWREIEVEFFQDPQFKNKEYLERYKERLIEIIEEINPPADGTLIKICSGYVISRARESLRERSYTVEVTEIGEPLQSWLEEQNRRYIEQLVGRDVYYDPKRLSKEEVAKRFNEVVTFARENDLMHLAKTGWKCFQ